MFMNKKRTNTTLSEETIEILESVSLEILGEKNISAAIEILARKVKREKSIELGKIEIGDQNE